MKLRTIVSLTAAASVVLGLVAVAPASAYDKKSYGYAASHMIDRSDIAKSLGQFRKTMAFNAYSSNGPYSLCTIPGTGSLPDTDVTIPQGKFRFSANYGAKGNGPQALWVDVEQYADANKAIAAFNEGKVAVKKCTGTVTNSWTDPTTNEVTTYTVAIENGVVPSVSTLGVESLFVNVNSDSTATSQEAPWHNDDYTVYTLINNVIIATHFSTGATLNISPKQRKGANKTAFNAQTAWLS